MTSASRPDSDGQSPQWTAELIQLLNWGGFHGYNRIPLNADSTLISGGSGTGKSTMMDSYIALMMPHTVAFNGASNAVKGRARSEDQRSILSYMRGKTDTVEDRETGESVDRVLRGAATSVASAIAVTFRNENDQQFTAARLMYAKASATRDTEVIKKWVTLPGPFDVESAYQFAADQFPPTPMKARYPGIRFYESYDGFAHSLFVSLSIGSRGEGENALKLLSRIQSGQQESTVDDLYKKLVLELPPTYDEAKKVIAHFDDLSDLYEELRRDQQQIDTLSDIRTQYETYQEALIALSTVSSLGHTKPADSTFALWSATIRSAALASELENLQLQKAAAISAVDASTRTVTELEVRQSDLIEQIRDNGGEALTRLEQELKELQAELLKAEGLYADFLNRTAVLGTVAETADDFLVLQGLAEETLATLDEERTTLEQQRRNAGVEGGLLIEKLNEMQADLVSLIERKGSRVPRGLSDSRDQLAHSAGLERRELPFIAELLDVHPDDERWRTAAEAVMGGFVRTVVFDKRLLDNFTRRIDKTAPHQRISYQGVPLDLPDAPHAHPRTIAGKLIFKEGPFKGWLEKRVADLFDHECVDTPEELRSDGRRRVALSGQERLGTRGAHGVGKHVIGFSNEELIAALRGEIDQMNGRLVELVAAERTANDAIAELENLKRAHEEVLRTDWRDVDVVAVINKIAENEAQQAQILAAENVLATLRAQKTSIDEQLAKARRAQAKNEIHRDSVAEGIDTCGAQLRTATDEAARLTAIGVDPVTDSQREMLAPLLADTYTGDIDYLETAIGKVRSRLTTQLASDNLRATTARNAIERAFRTFKTSWDNYDWGTDIESYRDYKDHLDMLQTTGLADHRDQFAQKVARWSGADLVELKRAFRIARDSIQTRLDAVNRILDGIPFGAGKDRLHIKSKHHTNQLMAKFTSEMEILASAATDFAADDMTSEEIDNRYRSIDTFIKYLLPGDRLPKGEQSVRDELLDVRRHVSIVAERVDKDTGDLLSTYNSLGGKSGGETQELMAFIVGAALRYQLGDESRARPRFAPVLLDEGFIKADSQFAGRAVEAWRKLGFQLIVGSVIDKVSAIEPYVSLILQVTKSPEGYSHVSVFTAETTNVAVEEHQHEDA
jgi:uncharacterized protein YPO0396